jgi:hypothetical protein
MVTLEFVSGGVYSFTPGVEEIDMAPCTDGVDYEIAVDHIPHRMEP